jgi:hypothetical protein
MSLTAEEIRLIRSRNLSRRSEFLELAREVCEMMDVQSAKICGVTRGDNRTCEARDMICLIAADRGMHPADIARWIRRDRTSVIKAIARAREGAGE